MISKKEFITKGRMNRFIPVEIFENKLESLKDYYRGQELADIIAVLETDVYKINAPQPFDNVEYEECRNNFQSIPYILVDMNTALPVLSYGKQVVRFNVNEYGKTMK